MTEIWTPPARQMPMDHLSIPLGFAYDPLGLDEPVPIVLQLGSGGGTHVLMTGETGSGKSTTMARIGGQLCMMPGVMIVGFDAKGAMELGDYRARAAQVAHTFDRPAKAVRGSNEASLHLAAWRFASLLDQRMEYMQSTGSIEEEVLSTKKWSLEEGPWAIAVIDELNEFKGHPDLLEIFDRLARLGRALGILLIIGSQKALMTDLGSTFISQLGTRLVHKGLIQDMRTALSDQKAEVDPEIPPGTCYTMGVPGIAEGQTLAISEPSEENRREAFFRTMDFRIDWEDVLHPQYERIAHHHAASSSSK